VRETAKEVKGRSRVSGVRSQVLGMVMAEPATGSAIL
jgi:hypothetical protein